MIVFLPPVDKKNSIFIPEQRKNRLNHFLKITNGLLPKERIRIRRRIRLNQEIKKKE